MIIYQVSTRAKTQTSAAGSRIYVLNIMLNSGKEEKS